MKPSSNRRSVACFSAETAAENSSYLRKKVDELRVEVTRIATVKDELHDAVEGHSKAIRDLTAFKNRAIGRGSVLTALGAVIGGAVAHLLDLGKHG